MLDFPYVCRLCLIPCKNNPCIYIFDEKNEIPSKILELSNLQGVLGVPATASDSYGSQTSNDFNKNIGTAISNIHGGIQSLTQPMYAFGFDTIPGIVSRGFSTAQQTLGKIVGAKKNAIGKVASGVGNVVGNGVVLGSALAGGTMKVTGSGLGVVNEAIKAGANAGINIAAQIGEKAAKVNEIGGNLGKGALQGVANALKASTDGTTNLSGSLSKMADSVATTFSKQVHNFADNIQERINKVSQSVEDGTTLRADQISKQYQNIISTYKQVLLTIQKFFDVISSSIAPAETSIVTDLTPETGDTLPEAGVASASTDTTAARKVPITDN